MKIGADIRWGPFTLLDLLGLDTHMFVAEVMFAEFREPATAPPPYYPPHSRNWTVTRPRAQNRQEERPRLYDYSTK